MASGNIWAPPRNTKQHLIVTSFVLQSFPTEVFMCIKTKMMMQLLFKLSPQSQPNSIFKFLLFFNFFAVDAGHKHLFKVHLKNY